MKSLVSILAAVLLAGTIIAACSVADISPVASRGLSPAVITTSLQGAQAASAIIQSRELIVTSTQLFKSLGFIAQSQMVSTVSGTGTGTCADYGSYNYARVYNTNGTYSLSFTFSQCRESDFQYDGTYSAIGTTAQFTGGLGSLKILNFKNNYTTLIGSLVASGLSYQMVGSGNAANGNYTFLANGGIQAFDYYSLGQHNMTFSALVTDFTVSTDVATSIQTSVFTANGLYSVTRLNSTTGITYTNFTVNAQKQLLTNIEDITIAGRIVVSRNASSGFSGMFDIATPTPIKTVLVPYPPTTTQGTMVTNNSATAQYGNPDTIIVSVGTDTPQSFAKEFMLIKQGDFYAMEQQLPIVSGTTGTASGTVMSISALSSGPSAISLDCYTDVHVSYFISTAPTTTIPDWYVHWASGLNTCVPQAGIPYQEATSSTGVATNPCDVGLDINGADTDITSGGVEHFLAAALPTGYYILSIDNYSCATTVTNDATILVGDYLFGPYNCTYSSSDLDGSTPGAWCRLADIRVNGGVIDVLAPDGAIPPWHP